MIRADRRPNVATPVSRYRSAGVPVDGYGRYSASPSAAARPTSHESCQLVNHYDFAKGVLRLLAQLRLEVNKWYEAFYDSESRSVSNLTEQDVTKR
ncbi:hypothetical protein Y032_0067g125 [Ancylostoma ceylanicum]|uniref:Uncharacterized protein n=1 Tax=Ancylostoma ceylanicum TaxID=53326 RepID=A0A016U0I5_9BILA|nr:hypothetical protein Y032_0067g125 [Ancylostoma ceylanicum]